MVRINLLPIRHILRKRELKNFGITALAILVVAFGLMGLAYTYVSVKIGDLNTEKTKQEAKLNKLKQRNQEINALKAEIARLQKQVDTIEKLTKIRDTPAPFMGAVSLAIPDEVWVQNMTKSGRSFTLDGIGVDNTVIVKFVENLQRIRKNYTAKQPRIDPGKKDEPFFGDVRLVQVVRSGARGALGSMQFKIVGTLR
ncbi:MAG: PilN domain-containing protein [Thermodesulfobacteriota bacterium]